MDSYFTTKNKALCCGCSACVSICPQNKGKMVEDERGHFYPEFNRENCADCGMCERVCPFVNAESVLNPRQKTCYALTTNDGEMRFKSASGGAFTSIVEAFCDDDTVIIGAEMCDDLCVRHTAAYSVAEAKKFRKSKYVQSEINGMYSLTRKLLKEGKKVLFTGTGCQIGGLKCFLQKDYENLSTVDLICHGVPGRRLFSKYIESLENRYKKQVVAYDFRGKISVNNLGGGDVLAENVKFKDSSEIITPGYTSKYLRAYLAGKMNMESCYNCKFARPERAGDITIADFWGIERFNADFNTGEGVSLVIVNSEKGRKVFERLENVKTFETTLENAAEDNGNLIKPSVKPHDSDKFVGLALKDFDLAVSKYCKLGVKARISILIPAPIKKMIKRIIGRK